MDQNSCRFCLGRFNKMLNIFNNQLTFDISSLLNDLCGISISLNDGCSDKMCELCCEKIKIVQNFKVLCLRTNQQLQPTTSFTPHQDTNDISYKIEANDDSHESDNNDQDWTFQRVKKAPKKPSKNQQKERNFMCAECGKSFRASHILKEHEMLHLATEKFCCDFCGKSFQVKSYLLKHMRFHMTERHYKCGDCPKAYTNSSALKTHQKLSHSSIKPFLCPECGKGFALKSQLVSHSRVHSGEKPYRCEWDYCDKAYSQKIDLKRHMQHHTGIMAYTCPFAGCGRTFTKKSNMDSHLPSHTGQLPHRCNICNQEFRRSTTLKKHMEIHQDAIQLHPFQSTSSAAHHFNIL